MLSPYRVLDLTDERGQLCGQILGDLGADVVIVEPPGGSRTRSFGPWVDGEPDPTRSLSWFALNRNKRSVIADLATEPGRARVRELAAASDILVESFAPGYLDSIGLGPAALAEINPGLVVVSITPFGQDGPKAGWASSDITALAASGVLNITGDSSRAPSRVAVPQAFFHAAAEGAATALVALAARERDGGRGQHVDISAQTAAMMAMQSMSLNHGWNESPIERFGGGVKIGPLSLRFVQPAADGYVSVTFLFGSALGPFSRRLMEVMHERGFVDEATRDKDWLGYTGLILSGQEPVSELMRCNEAIGVFTRAHTKAELFELAMTRGLLIVPVATTDDLVHSPQLAARDYWTPIEHDELGRSITYPGPFAKFSATPITYRHPPPLPGEHEAEVAAEWTPRPRSGAPASSAARPPALDGMKVLDFMWVFAGPAGSRSLADFGATQVKIESTLRIDTARTLNPYKDKTPGPERSGVFISINSGKLGITLNLAKPEGREIALKLVRWADVVLESYSPKAMRAWGLDYESLKAVNPGIIMLSSCLNGQTGPHAMLAGFGTMGAQLAGFGELAGWPDLPPAGPFGAYTDYVAPKFTVAAVLAALDHRRRTGQGQYIDLSQAECSLHFLGQAFLDNIVNGHVWTRAGNASPDFAPHGVFPCAGEDRWAAIACETEAQWSALCQATGNPGWAADARFVTFEARQANREALEAAISEWTAGRSVEDVENTLQAAGVPCHRASTTQDLFEDPQLIHRRHFVTVEHGELGPVPVENVRAHLSGTPGSVRSAGPTFGQHNEQVLREILGLSEDEVIELVAAGALE